MKYSPPRLGAPHLLFNEVDQQRSPPDVPLPVPLPEPTINEDAARSTEFDVDEAEAACSSSATK
jgi:hypothetical protein